MKAVDSDGNLLFRKKQHPECQKHGKAVPADGGDRSPPYPHCRERADSENQKRIKDKIEHDSCDLKPHGGQHISGGLYHFLDGNMNHIGDLHKGAHTHILQTQRINFRILCERSKIRLHQQ